MAKRNRQSLNARRLTKVQVRELIVGGSIPRPDLLANTNKVWGAIYELPGDRILAVLGGDLVGTSLSGKGDIYPVAGFQRMVAWCERVNVDSAHGRGDAVSHWAYYSRAKTALPERIDALLANLPTVLSVDPRLLDLSYPSLDAISCAVQLQGTEPAIERAYDELVAYVGEMMRRRLKGAWTVTSDRQQPYPYIQLRGDVQAMPINAVHEALAGPRSPDLRAATASESRRAALDARIRDGLPELA